jgi:hypothetical protein
MCRGCRPRQPGSLRGEPMRAARAELASRDKAECSGYDGLEKRQHNEHRRDEQKACISLTV